MSENPDEDRDLLFRRAAFGRIVDDFMSSDIGRYLVARAKDEADTKTMALKNIDASDANMIRKLQAEIWRAETIEKWLVDAVGDGAQAENLLEDRG